MKEPWEDIPPTWECCRCGEEYDNGPDGARPEAFEIKTENGKRVRGGWICRECYRKQDA